MNPSDLPPRDQLMIRAWDAARMRAALTAGERPRSALLRPLTIGALAAACGAALIRFL